MKQYENSEIEKHQPKKEDGRSRRRLLRRWQWLVFDANAANTRAAWKPKFGLGFTFVFEFLVLVIRLFY